MITVIFYNCILLFSTFFVWLSEKGKGNLERYFFLSLAFLIVFIPSAIRYDIGTDYLNYLHIYENQWIESYIYREPFFYFINHFLYKLGANSQWFFAISAFIFTFIVFKAYPKKSSWLLHFIFFSTLFYFSFNGIRQAIALSWALLAILYFFDKRYILFCIFIAIGSAFHQSILFVGMVGLCSLIPFNIHLKTKVFPMLFIGFVIFALLSAKIVMEYIEYLLNLIGFVRYADYFHNTTHFISRDFGTGLGLLVKLMFSIYIIVNAKYFIKINKNYWLLIIMNFLYALSIILTNQIIIFGRMADTFVLAPIIAAYLLFQLPKNIHMNRLALLLFVIFLLLSYSKMGMGVKNSYGNPKLNPYQTIFKEL